MREFEYYGFLKRVAGKSLPPNPAELLSHEEYARWTQDGWRVYREPGAVTVGEGQAKRVIGYNFIFYKQKN